MRKTISTLLFLLFLGAALFSGWKLLSIFREYRQSDERYGELTQTYVQLAPAQPDDGPEEQPDGQPGEQLPLTVDFDALLAQCPDVVGWLYCPDTPINYPVVQAEDNQYYLRRLLDGTWDISGSLFMDYRCAADLSGWNTVIYGHNMKHGAMFGTLQNYKKQDYYDAHPVLYLLTPGENYRIDLVGGYTTEGASEDTYGLPDSQEGRDVLLDKARENTTFQTETAVGEGERLITLSTCAYESDNARYVLVGVLREF